MHMKLTPTEPPRTCALRDTCTSTIVCGAQQVVHDCQGGVQHIERWNCGSHANLNREQILPDIVPDEPHASRMV